MRRIIIIVLALSLSMGMVAAKAPGYELRPQNRNVSDTTDVLCIGNSFTYYYDTYNMLKEIAWSEGHFINVKAACVGGYTFGCHLADPVTLKALHRRGSKGYDCVFLQNQSQINAFYSREPKRFAVTLRDAKRLVKEARVYSPNARYFFESTWAFQNYNCGDFGTLEAFDAALLKGTEKIARTCKGEVSPIGNAFALCRARYPEINLLYKDNHHQSMAGAYLKSCVNYLLIFGGSFSDGTSTCTLDKDVAIKLQQVASDAVTTYKKK